jgi:hypothetical protein
LGARLNGIQEVGGSIPPGSTKFSSYLAEKLFEKGIFPHGHRRMRVATAAMVMRVSATAVSCS